ncbi:hypothetical protein ACFV30_33925 [Streptomyces sp. NPDC059752]
MAAALVDGRLVLTLAAEDTWDGDPSGRRPDSAPGRPERMW